MVALRRLTNRTPKPFPLIPQTLFISHRDIASKLFVGGLSFYTTEKGLLDAFSLHGQVMEVMDRVSDKSKGFGFVTCASEDEAEKAIDEMNGKDLNGRVIFVDYAKPTRSFGGGMPIARGPPDSVDNIHVKDIGNPSSSPEDCIEIEARSRTVEVCKEVLRLKNLVKKLWQNS